MNDLWPHLYPSCVNIIISAVWIVYSITPFFGSPDKSIGCANSGLSNTKIYHLNEKIQNNIENMIWHIICTFIWSSIGFFANIFSGKNVKLFCERSSQNRNGLFENKPFGNVVSELLFIRSVVRYGKCLKVSGWKSCKKKINWKHMKLDEYLKLLW